MGLGPAVIEALHVLFHAEEATLALHLMVLGVAFATGFAASVVSSYDWVDWAVCFANHDMCARVCNVRVRG